MKKVLSIVLCFALLISMVTVSLSAANIEAELISANIVPNDASITSLNGEQPQCPDCGIGILQDRQKPIKQIVNKYTCEHGYEEGDDYVLQSCILKYGYCNNCHTETPYDIIHLNEFEIRCDGFNR